MQQGLLFDSKRRFLVAAALVVLTFTGSLGWLWDGLALGQDPEEEGQQIRGQLEVIDGEERSPVEGVEIVVSVDGEEIGRASSDAAGEWSVPVPQPGTYQVRMEVGSLPSGVQLTDPERVELSEVQVREGQSKTVRFNLGPGLSKSLSRVEHFSNLVVLGLRLGAIIALSSVGLSLLYSISGMFNFAHGDLVTLGAMLAYFLNTSPEGPGWHLAVAAVPTMFMAGGIGGLMEFGLWRPLRRRATGIVALTLVSIGLSLVLRYLLQVIFGERPKPYRNYNIQESVEFLTFSAPPKYFFIIGITALLLAVGGLLMRYTRIGTAIRAVADNRDLAEASGIDTHHVFLVTWIVGTGLTALGGVFLGISESVEWDMGFRLLLLIFAGMVLGGIGTTFGALVGGLVIGLLVEVSTYWVDVQFKTAIGLGILVLMLLFRPQGLLGTRERVG